MLKNKKNVRKFRNILISLITIIMTLWVFISQIIQIKEIKTIGTDKLKHMNASTTIDMGYGTINPIYRPEWTKVSSALDTTNKTLSVVVKGNASKTQTINGVNINYSSDVTSTLAPEDITVYVDGELDGDTNKNGVIDTGETPSIQVAVSAASPSSTSAEVTHTITLSNIIETIGRQSGKNFTEWSGNVAIKIAGRGEDETTYTEDVLTDAYGNQNMMETDESGSWVEVTFKDGEIDHNTDGTMFTDFIGPEFTYEYSNTVIDHGTETVTIGFDISDKYFKASTLTANDITVVVDGVTTTNATKTLNKTAIFVMNKETKQITTQSADYTVQSTEQKVGERYELVITDLDQGDADKYSGVMTLAFPAGIATDLSNNGNISKTITVGIDDPANGDGHDSAEIVDVADPIWQTENIVIDEDNNQVTLDLIATDKYYSNNTLTPNDILVYVDGVLDGDTNGNNILDEGETLTPTINRTLSTATAITNGEKYTLTISNWDADKYSGTTKIVILKDTITDQYGNNSNQQEFPIGHIDFIKPVITPISSTIDTATKTETIVFKATDKFMDMTDLITIGEGGTADEITV